MPHRDDLTPTLWAAVVAVAGVVAAAWLVVVGGDSFFTTDDHVFFGQALWFEFDGHFLTEPIYDHFSPWHRLLDHVVGSTTDQGWWLALTISVGWYAATLALFALLVRRLVGRHPAGLAVIVLFAISPVFVEAVQWWALSTQLFPQLVFTLGVLLAGLDWQAARRTRSLLAAWLAYALALCAFIKALLALPLLALVLCARPGAREPLRTIVRRDRWLWAGLLVLTAAYAVVVSDDRYYRFIGDLPGPSVSQWAKFVVAAWGEGIAPLFLGGTVPRELGAGNVLVLLAGNLGVLALIALTVWANRATVVTWAVALGIVAAGFVMTGRARITEIGIEPTALDIRYHAEGLLALLLAAALSLQAAWRPLPPSRLRIAAAVVGAVAVAFAVDAGLRLKDTWIGAQHRAYFDRVEETHRQHPGVDIIDQSAPNSIVTVTIVPWNLLSMILPERVPDAHIGTEAGPPATVGLDGTVRPVELEELKTVPATCAPFSLDANTSGAEDALVLTLRRRGDLPRSHATVVADSGIPGGAPVAGFTVPQIQITPLLFVAGQRVKRVLVALGPMKTIAINPGAGAPPCPYEVTVSRYPLTG